MAQNCQPKLVSSPGRGFGIQSKRKILTRFLLSSILLASCIPPNSVHGAVFVPSHNGIHRRNKDVASAASAMKSIAFLSELVKQNSTSDVTYYQSSITNDGNQRTIGNVDDIPTTARYHFLHSIGTRIRGGTQSEGSRIYKSKRKRKKIGSDFSSVTTEYTGNISGWLPVFRNKGIRFRETVSISHISADGNSATVECVTKLKKSNAWVDCSRVTCQLAKVHNGIEITADSNVLIKIPLPGVAGKAIRSKISSAFESAVESFFDVTTIQQYNEMQGVQRKVQRIENIHSLNNFT